MLTDFVFRKLRYFAPLIYSTHPLFPLTVIFTAIMDDNRQSFRVIEDPYRVISFLQLLVIFFFNNLLNCWEQF